jgi:hypothetical protein
VGGGLLDIKTLPRSRQESATPAPGSAAWLRTRFSVTVREGRQLPCHHFACFVLFLDLNVQVVVGRIVSNENATSAVPMPAVTVPVLISSESLHWPVVLPVPAAALLSIR